jgi:DNA-binding protein YbaB
MAVTGLPSADSLVGPANAVRRKLVTEEIGFRNTAFSATSTDTKVTATANGMVEAVTVTVQPSAYPTAFPAAALTSLAASVKDACGKVLTNANNDTKAKASADAAGYTLTGIPNLGQAPPNNPTFQSSDADLTALLRAQDPIIAAKQFQGISGPVSAIVDGTLTLVSITLTLPMPLSKTEFEENVVIAINLALTKAKHLFEDGILKRVNDGVDSSAVTFPTACLWAQGDLALADRVQTKVGNTAAFAPVVNAGTGGTIGTNIGVNAQTGDLWSRAPVELLNFSTVNGNLRGMAKVQLDDHASVTGIKVENGALLQIPKLSLSVTFPGTNLGNRTLPDQNNNKTLDLLPGNYADITINSQCTLTLHTGTYFFNNWTMQSASTLLTVSGGGLIVVHVRNGFTFRATMRESQGTARPNLFVGVYGTGAVPLDAPFTGTLIALTSSVTLSTPPVQTPPVFHSGAIYAQNITVNPDVIFHHFPFQGPPTPTST